MDARGGRRSWVNDPKGKLTMRYPWLGIPFAAPRPGRAADYPPRRERAADRRPPALLAAPALALTAWLGVITVALVDEDSSRADRSAAPGDATFEGPSAPPGSAGSGIAPLPRQF
jgi:hypothetical protein